MTPDDHYSPNTTCHHCHNLQHYLLNITKYFTSNTQLLFLPGLHHLHTDLIIQNVHNISLIGGTANGTTLDTVIIQCNSLAGIVMSNIADLSMANFMIENCHIDNNFLNIPLQIGMIFSHCYNVQLQNIIVWRSDHLYRTTIVAINVLGHSSFINVTSHGLAIKYNEENVDNIYNKLLIENYQILSTPNIYLGIPIIIYLYQKTYKIELEVYNTRFVALNTANILLKVTQTNNEFGNFIHFHQCIVEKFNNINDIIINYDHLFQFVSMHYYLCKGHHQITFTNCIFQYNRLSALIIVHASKVNMKLAGCIFKYNQLQFTLISIRKLFHQKNSMIIVNTSFYAITSNSTLLDISDAFIHLEGPVKFNKLRAHRIFYLRTFNIITCHDYIEFSQNVVSFTDYIYYIIVQENTLINMTNNTYRTTKQVDLHHYKIHAISEFTAPCYYQYTAKGQNFDKITGKLNFSIVFHNDISISTLGTAHCRWLPGSAFNSTKPVDINTRLINSDFPLLYDKIVCNCFYDKSMPDCYIDTLATVYPGQTISVSLGLNYQYNHLDGSSKHIDITFLTVGIYDGALPPTACKLAKVNKVIHKIYYTSCTVVTNFTIAHSGLRYLQWCELFIQIQLSHHTDVYYINILPCPPGFVQQNDVCICDPILKLILLITTCDINHQTVLRPAGSWLSAVTINDSHQYHISTHCPLHYCLPQSSQLNFFTPNSQCQFNRSGLLCGHCQQGLSTVFGYYHCQHCSNVYLLLIIPIAVAGLVLVLLLFTLNLTVTDGDINGFLLYVNIISINNHVFFPQYHKFINFWYAFISLANLDLGIPTCFYNGMDDYAKMWLQLAFPAYLILIATLLIITSRHSTKVQRITARRALPVLATLFLLSYTKILRTVSSVLFYYSTITRLPSGHTTLVWAVDANVSLFGLKYTTLFVVCLILFAILLPFNAILCFTKTAMRLRLVNHFKPLIDAYQGPYKYKYYYWTGLHLVIRAIFFGLSALDRNINLTVAIILLAAIIFIQRSLIPFKDNYKNLHEAAFLFNLLTIYTLSYEQYNTAINVMITIVALQFLLIIIHHMISNICGGVTLYKLKIFIETTMKWINRSQNKPQYRIELNNTPPDKAYNYQKLREPLVSQD